VTSGGATPISGELEDHAFSRLSRPVIEGLEVIEHPRRVSRSLSQQRTGREREI